MENVQDKNFTISESSEVWVLDITHIYTNEGFYI